VLKLDYFIIGFFQELVTIPIMIGALALFVLAIISVYLEGFSIKSYAFWSMIILLIMIIVIFGSFIF
jgi:hypothetical protein